MSTVLAKRVRRSASRPDVRASRTDRPAGSAPGRTPWPSGLLVGTVLVWVAAVLSIDSHDTISTQRVLGVVTWTLLVVVLRRESSIVRWQTAVVVCFATLVEYTASPLLHVYLYRFHNVPAYVPPGHGLVYLGALAIGRSALVRRHLRAAAAGVVVVGGGWATYGLLLAPRTDVLGAIWFGCLLGFLRWGPSRGLYVGAFVVVSYLELMGTSLGTWAWQPHDPTGLIPIGNPPSGAAGGYGWFDLAALLLAPVLADGWNRLRHRLQRTDDERTTA